jgi:hypothetical protein
MIKLLSKKIKDGRFLELIKRFLKAGYFEFKQVHNSLSGTPQGGIIGPILANIYLHELDKFVESIIKEYSTENIRRGNPEYQKLNYARFVANKNHIKVKYTRYVDDFVICIIGSKELAHGIRLKVKDFLEKELKLELNLEKTIITNLGENKVRFLGYEITKTRDNTIIKKNTLGIKRRLANESIQLLVPGDVINDKLKPFMRNGNSVHHGARINLPILDMINEFNSEIRGLYNYYALATDVSTKLGRFKFYHYLSLAKTIARKEKSSVKKVINRYGIEVPLKQSTGTRKIIGVRYETKGEIKTMTYFNESLSKINQPRTGAHDRLIVDIPVRHQILDRINANTCKLCGSNENIEIHHVRKLKDIRQRYARRGDKIPNWVLAMSSVNRKTLIVCKKCHVDIHGGKI